MDRRLISGSSSVSVTADSTSRSTSGDRSGSLGWGTLQSGHRQDTLWDVQLLSEEVHTLVSQGVVVVLPRELSLDVTLGGQGLQGLDDVQVLGVNLLVLWLVEVLLGDNNTLCLLVLVCDSDWCRFRFVLIGLVLIAMGAFQFGLRCGPHRCNAGNGSREATDIGSTAMEFTYLGRGTGESSFCRPLSSTCWAGLD